ncbi:hypothetical protein BYT27DRAFT_7318460, partial [Phlegmacium glaucopus]
PAAMNTELADPFKAPPEHLLNNPDIQSTLSKLNDYVKVKTPFNVDKLELFLTDHPNPSFVKSVMRSLREGFWPFNEGDWEDTSEDLSNYSSQDIDLDAIRAFRDKECEAHHWSPPLPFQQILPGMKLSPMFVIWQKQKPRVITDHSGSGLNYGIPKEESRVHYNDMHPFG